MAFAPKLLVLLVSISVCFCESQNCDQYGVLLYEDIGCKPVNANGKECPSKYDCDLGESKSGCRFKGKTYGDSEGIPGESSCRMGCRCIASKIECGILDCPENMGYTYEPGCYDSYELGDCCASGKICNTTKVKTCEVDGKSHEIGQEFYPKNTCFNCVCHENFNGEYDEKTCKRISCAVQIDHDSELVKNCAPAYYNDKIICCPHHWICPDSSDTFELINSNAVQDNGLECSYGEKKLKLGEGFRRKELVWSEYRDYQCECILPPLLTCKQV